jgi:transposase
MAKKTFRPYDPQARVELPGDLRQYLPLDHPVFLIEDLVESLDLSPITSVYEQGDGRGQPPYHPVLLSKLLLHAYCEGESSSRVIMRKTYEDIGYRVLCVDQHPDFRTISDFRERHLVAFLVLFKDTVRLANELGQVRLAHVAQDGSKVLANASKHKAMSYDRMQEKDKQIRAEVKQLLEQAEAADAEEDARHGRDRRGDELPEELQRRESRLKKIREAKRALEARAREKAAAAGVDSKAAKPKEKDQYNFTDPESRIMKGADGFVQGYNAQAVVEPTLQLIVGQAVTDATNDKQQLMPMLKTMEEQSGQRPQEVLADSGYCSETNLEQLNADQDPERQIVGYIATERQKHDEYRKPCPRGPLLKGATRVERMKRKLQTKAGKAIYAARKTIVEPVFGQIKHARGFRQFLLRGIDKVRGEWSLVCLTHNILKFYRLCCQ